MLNIVFHREQERYSPLTILWLLLLSLSQCALSYSAEEEEEEKEEEGKKKTITRTKKKKIKIEGEKEEEERVERCMLNGSAGNALSLSLARVSLASLSKGQKFQRRNFKKIGAH